MIRASAEDAFAEAMATCCGLLGRTAGHVVRDEHGHQHGQEVRYSRRLRQELRRLDRPSELQATSRFARNTLAQAAALCAAMAVFQLPVLEWLSTTEGSCAGAHSSTCCQ